MGIFDIFRKGKDKAKSEPYDPFTEIEKRHGNLEAFNKKLLNSSLIVLITGKRGSGKTALGMKFLEFFYVMHKRKCYTLGYEKSRLPGWIRKVGNIDEIPNNSIALIDEGAVTFSSREAMKNPNKELGKLMAIARHKNLTLILIAQNSAMIDLNVLRLADTLAFKEPSLLQSKFERKAIKDMYDKITPLFKNREQPKACFYLWDDDYEGLLSYGLPQFWTDEISRSFKNY